ncbi:MAG TPA: OmpH family outer membrane protein [Bacteroidota bacterium]|nr:OmpH family outer membrane protein [Bacteroidota bacterium]
MKTIAFSLTILLFLALTAGGTAASAQTTGLKLGFVNSSKVLQEFPEAQDVNKKLEGMTRQWQAELEKMGKDLQMKYEDFQKKEPLLKEDEKQVRRQELIELEQRGVQFRQDKFGSDGQLAVLTDSLLTPIKQKVIKVIEQVARDEKLQFIFDRNDQIMVVLYGDPKFDYTNLVIDRLKRGQ